MCTSSDGLLAAQCIPRVAAIVLNEHLTTHGNLYRLLLVPAADRSCGRCHIVGRVLHPTNVLLLGMLYQLYSATRDMHNAYSIQVRVLGILCMCNRLGVGKLVNLESVGKLTQHCDAVLQQRPAQPCKC